MCGYKRLLATRHFFLLKTTFPPISRSFRPLSIHLLPLPSFSVVSELYCIISLWSAPVFLLLILLCLEMLPSVCTSQTGCPCVICTSSFTISSVHIAAALCNFLLPQTYIVAATYRGFFRLFFEVTELDQRGVSWYLREFLIDCCLKVQCFPCQCDRKAMVRN